MQRGCENDNASYRLEMFSEREPSTGTVKVTSLVNVGPESKLYNYCSP